MKLRIPNKLHHEIIPGILEQDWEKIEEKMKIISTFAQGAPQEQSAYSTKSVHIDVLDGIFAPNKTWIDPSPFKKFSQDIVLEVHLMVDNPIQYIKPYADAGFTRFIGHVEKMPDQVEFVALGEQYGEVGLAVDSETKIDAITVSLEDLDFVFFMTVKAGFSNQSFLPDMLKKVKAVRKKDPLIPIEVDGGINNKTIVKAKKAGATRFVSTGYIFGSDNPKEQYNHLCHLVK